jgi:pimeloyl-ACP methyl ester carboxylesterase
MRLLLCRSSGLLLGAILALSFLSPAIPVAAEDSSNGMYANLPGVKLWFTDSGGAGTPIILLHSNTGTSEIWVDQIAAFSKAGYRVIAFDRRGWGRSTADPSGPQPGSIAGDLDGLVDYLKLGKFHLLGVAGGGFAALDYAAWRPEHIRSLIIGGSTGDLRQDKETADFIARIEIPEIRKQSAVYLEVAPSYRGANVDGTKRWIEINEHSRQPGATSQPLHTPNTLAKIETITAPTLLIAADADLLAPPALMRLWAAHMKSQEFAVMQDAGHAMAWEQPDVFNKLVLDFLARH